jgi:hypothetical protein
MKKIITLALVVLYGFALVRPALPLIEYFIKYNEYQLRCINKERPQLHCNGQCILMQKLRALNVSDQQTSPPLPAKVNFDDYPLALVESSKQTPHVSGHSKVLCDRILQTSVTPAHLSDIFHPPLV